MNKHSNVGSQSKKRILFTRCCDGDATAEELHAMTDRAIEITYRTFAKHVDVESIASSMGYAVGRAKGLRLSDDWAVHFHRSKFRGVPCYYMDHSRIEHIFVFPEQFKALSR